MKTHQILCQHTGEQSCTAKDAIAVFTGQVDLTETVTCILNSDDWRLVETSKWAVVEMSLPDWLEPEDWIRNRIQWKYLWGFGAEVSWPESWQRGLLHLGESHRYACIKLLKTQAFRSEFRKSMRDHLVAWLETPPDARQYGSPFSSRQWDCLLSNHDCRAAKRLGEEIYRSR